MLLIDSSGWLEFFMDAPLADTYAQYLNHSRDLLTPTIILYEVYKVIKRQKSEEAALTAIAQMGTTKIVPLNDTTALTAADVSLTYKLAVADAIVYATALIYKAKLVTSDADLASLPDIVYHKK